MSQKQNKKLISRFTGVEPKSLTLRFELKPTEETRMHLAENWQLLRDDERHKAYPIAKEVLDREHRKLISSVLERIEAEENINWETLGNLLSFNSAREEKTAVEIVQEQKQLREFIAKQMKADKDYGLLFGKFPFAKNGKVLQAILTEEERKAIEEFEGFSVYFTNYYHSRENFYSAENISVSVANRIVNDNFSRYCHNREIYAQVKEAAPELIAQIKEVCQREQLEFDERVLSEYNGFNQTLSQKGIDSYNTLIGIYNMQANLYAQQHRAEFDVNSIFQKHTRYKLLPLYKQILSIVDKKVIVEQYTEDKEVLLDLDELMTRLQSADKDGVIQKINDLFVGRETADFAGIYIKCDALSEVSILLGGGWNLLEDALRNYYKVQLSEKLTGAKLEEEIERRVKKGGVSLWDIQRALNEVNHMEETAAKEMFVEEGGQKNPKVYAVETILEEAERLTKQTQDFAIGLEKFLKEFDGSKSLKEVDIAPVKNYLDAWQSIIRYTKYFLFDELEKNYKDNEFYLMLNDLILQLKDIVALYNKVRNYVTQKPFKTDKMLLKFNNPTLADGWAIDKEREHGAVILRKEGRYYLGVFNPNDKPVMEADQTAENYYEKMVYSLFKDVSKMIPKCSTQLNEVKKHFSEHTEDYILDSARFKSPLIITREIYDLNNVLYNGKKKWQQDYLKQTGDEEGYQEAVSKWKRFCMDFLKSYKNTSDYDYSGLQPIEEYETVADLYNDVDKLLYKIEFVHVGEDAIEAMVRGGKMFLFEIYNKDFSARRKEGSKKNLHTLYWEALFSEENANVNIIKLNGGAELFFRPYSIKDVKVHKAGEVLVNKRTKEGKPIPSEIYLNLTAYYNGKGELSSTAKEFLASHEIYTSTRKYDLIKDKRYTKDKYFMHVPITLNYRADGAAKFNLQMLQAIKETEDLHIIGLDRGERNLISYVVINRDGVIVEQGSFNEINQMDYQEKLHQKQQERDKERKNWSGIETIKELKEGYISQVVHQVTELMEKYNAIIVMEELNYGFKRGRFKVEKQVYQKFENALIQKLNYMVTRKTEGSDMLEDGGILKGYQLTTIPKSVKAIGNQCGIIFYIPPAYTSKIDPTTGFADVFNYSKLKDRTSRKEFFSRFEDIFYDKERECFGFSFDYSLFDVYQTFFQTKWTIYSNTDESGAKHVYDKTERKNVLVNVTEKLQDLFRGYSIDYLAGNLKEQILDVPADIDHAKFWSSLEYYFRLIVRLRDSDNANGHTVIDRIVSPVLNDRKEFFITSDNPDSPLPMDADANGAYHIALKGLYLVEEKIEKTEIEDKLPKDFYKIPHAEWFRYVQEKRRG